MFCYGLEDQQVFTFRGQALYWANIVKRRVSNTTTMRFLDPGYEIKTPHEFMGKAAEHNLWFEFDPKDAVFKPIFLDPARLDPKKFPLDKWVSPKFKKPGKPNASLRILMKHRAGFTGPVVVECLEAA